MAFITLEDLLGPVEVIVFPRDYEANRDLFTEDSKLFIRGRVSIGDDPVGKLVCEQVIPFDSIPKELWLQFQIWGRISPGGSVCSPLCGPARKGPGWSFISRRR